MPAIRRIYPHARRGRSSVKFRFDSQVFDQPISSQVPYAFADTLLHENQLAIHREEGDLVYRGDVRPQDSAAGWGAGWSCTLSSDGEEEDQLAPTRPVTPKPTPSAALEYFSSPLTPLPQSRPVTPDPASSSALEHLSSPLTPMPKERRSIASPTVTDFGMKPTPHHIRTYLQRDKSRFQTEADRLAAEEAKADAAAKRRLADGLFQRQSLVGRVHGDSVDVHVWTYEELVQMGQSIVERDNEALTPLIDSKGVIMGVVAGPPKGRAEHWPQTMHNVEKAMRRVYRKAQFTNLGHQEARVRWGIGFGEWGAKPHIILDRSSNIPAVAAIRSSGVFNELAAYHNHLAQQIAPNVYSQLQYLVGELKTRRGISTPFRNSIFTTAEISFCDVPNLSRKNLESTFYGMEAITSCGSYDWEKRGGLILWDDDRVIPLRPGTTVVFPAGSKRYSFVPVAPHESRYLFRQYCHASALRWIEKGGFSDSEFDELATSEEKAAWQIKRANRGKDAAKKYTKLGDVYIF